MKKRLFAGVLVVILGLSTSCGNASNVSADTTQASVASETSKADLETETTTETENEDSMGSLDAIGDVEVDKGLFNVTLTIPKDFVGETTQEKIDSSVAEKGYKSGTLNEDGSVTYVMSKSQHEELVSAIKESIDEGLAEMVGSESTPNITEIKANDNYTKFTVVTKNAEPDLGEAFAVLQLYMYGGMYGIFAGEPTDNVEVEFVNADTGEVIDSANSANAN